MSAHKLPGKAKQDNLPPVYGKKIDDVEGETSLTENILANRKKISHWLFG
jgi:hypothetical protein